MEIYLALLVVRNRLSQVGYKSETLSDMFTVEMDNISAYQSGIYIQ